MLLHISRTRNNKLSESGNTLAKLIFLLCWNIFEYKIRIYFFLFLELCLQRCSLTLKVVNLKQNNLLWKKLCSWVFSSLFFGFSERTRLHRTAFLICHWFNLFMKIWLLALFFNFKIKTPTFSKFVFFPSKKFYRLKFR